MQVIYVSVAFFNLGEPCSIKLIHLIESIVINNCRIWNLYGPTEATIVCIVHLVDILIDTQSVPVGCPLPHYKCMIMDEFSQHSTTEQEGELFVGGVGIFAGYLDRDDLTAKVLVQINNETFYRTGDLVRMDHNGLLHYISRKDFQIKLHGQRIELGEIERCLHNTSISACVVIKWGDDHLVAYVQSADINEKQLRQHCQSHLPPHMIPSIFIVLKELPLNANGKIDRKCLPSPDLSSLPVSSVTEYNAPHNHFEERVHDVWCETLRRGAGKISTTTSFFSIGGHSLLFIELYHRYQSLFGFDSSQLSIALFLQQPTILQHSQLLQTVVINNFKSTQLWHTLHINQGN